MSWLYVKMFRNSFTYFLKLFHNFFLQILFPPNSHKMIFNSNFRNIIKNIEGDHPEFFIKCISISVHPFFPVWMKRSRTILPISLWLLFPLQFSVALLSLIIHFFWTFYFSLSVSFLGFFVANKYAQVSLTFNKTLILKTMSLFREKNLMATTSISFHPLATHSSTHCNLILPPLFPWSCI